MNKHLIARYTGIALLAYSFLMSVSLIFSICNGDSATIALLLSFMLTAICGSFPLIFVREKGALTARDAAGLLLSVLVTAAFFGILPYLVWAGGNILPQTAFPISLMLWKSSIYLFLLVTMTFCLIIMSRPEMTAKKAHHKIG